MNNAFTLDMLASARAAACAASGAELALLAKDQGVCLTTEQAEQWFSRARCANPAAPQPHSGKNGTYCPQEGDRVRYVGGGEHHGQLGTVVAGFQLFYLWILYVQLDNGSALNTIDMRLSAADFVRA